MNSIIVEFNGKTRKQDQRKSLDAAIRTAQKLTRQSNAFTVYVRQYQVNEKGFTELVTVFDYAV